MTAAAPAEPRLRGPNAERHAKTRAALLDAARQMFARDGYAAARTAEIVERAGMTRGALYHHFADKHALFDAVVEGIAEGVVGRIDAAATDAPDPLAALKRGSHAWLDAMAEPDLHRLFLVEGPSALGLRRWREIDGRHGGGSLRAGIEAVLGDSTADADALTALLTGALNEAAVWIAEAPDPAVARRAMRRAVDRLLTRLFSQ